MNKANTNHALREISGGDGSIGGKVRLEDQRNLERYSEEGFGTNRSG